ncbi:MAG: ABC transporter substrate-binding protein, partial [Alphaproteobacteria bacterium]
MKSISSFFLILFILIVCASPHSSAQNSSPEKVTIVQFGKERFLLYLPLYVAMEEGLFAKRGLDVQLKFGGNEDQVFASVISGSAQFGVADPVATAISHDKGGPGKTVAMMLTKLAIGGVAKDPKVPLIKKPKDLDGLRISSFPEPSTTYTLLKEIQRTNNLKNMKIVQAPMGGQMAMLEAGEVDIAADIEPSTSIAEDKGYRTVFD